MVKHAFVNLIVILICSNEIYGEDTPKMNFTDIIRTHGYPAEVHEIETDDGYLLDLHRVPYGVKSDNKTANENPIILNHGLMGSSENFVIGGPEKALAYILADKGYDVWLCNARGSWHSRKHRTMNPDTDMSKFWRFTFHEIGYYDLPATIDYILNITGKEKLHFVGHSQGTTTFFVMMAERPEYNGKVNVMVALAPSALLSHIKEPTLRIIAPTYRYLQILAESLGVYELIPKYLLSNEAMRQISRSLCEEQSVTRFLCSNVLIAMSGYTPDQLDPSTITLIASTGPGGASVYQALHYAQLVTTGKFAKYDWGAKENNERYNSSTASEYNFSNIVCPIALFYGDTDNLITKEDVVLLANSLPNVIDVYRIPLDSWSHMDFIWAKDVKKYLNRHLLRVLNKYLK